MWVLGGELEETRNPLERRASQCQPLDPIHHHLDVAQGEFSCFSLRMELVIRAPMFFRRMNSQG